MTEKLHRRGYRVQTDLRADIMGNTLVGEVMSREVVTIAVDASPADAANLVGTTGHNVLPVIDPDGHLTGVIARSELMGEDALVAGTVGELARIDVVTITRDATVGEASRLMMAEGVDHLPVVQDGTVLVGMCTRTDILKAASVALAAESREAGWLSRYRREPRPTSAAPRHRP
jgi:CBS domain-containing protein